MSRKFISFILAASIAVTSLSAVPAQAGNKNVNRIIFGAALLAIISQAVKDDNRHRPRASHQPRPQPQPRPLPHAASRKVLPTGCLVKVDTVNGRTRGFEKRCLEIHYANWQSLPNRCIRFGHVRGGGYALPVYAKRCMENKGYRTARR